MSTQPAAENRISKCASYFNDHYQSLSEQDLSKTLTLPCGCRDVSIGELVSAYICEKCNKTFWYSFCLEQVVEDGESWQCEICGSCY